MCAIGLHHSMKRTCVLILHRIGNNILYSNKLKKKKLSHCFIKGECDRLNSVMQVRKSK